MLSTLDPDVLASALARLDRAARRSGPPAAAAAPEPLPVQTLVVAAPDFRPDTTERAEQHALRLLQAYASDCVVLGRALRLPGWDALPTDPGRVDELLARLEAGDPTLSLRRPEAVAVHDVYRRLATALAHGAIQDLRIDFLDLLRPDDEVDADAGAVADGLARAFEQGKLPPRVGVRTGPMRPGSATRTLRTVDLVVSTLADRTGGALPEGFVVSVPGISSVAPVTALVQVLGHLEQRCGLRKGSVRLELGVDRAETILDPDGRVRVRELLSAARGRCSVLHVDTVALASSAGAGVASLVRDLVHLATAGTGVLVSAGASPPMPDLMGVAGSATQRAQRFAEVHAAWRDHAHGVSAHLHAGTPWGWDYDAGQLPARLAAVIWAARAGLHGALGQLGQTIELAMSEDPVGPDLLADGQARLEILLRWVDCGAVDARELEGLDETDLGARSFRVMVDRRRS